MKYTGMIRSFCAIALFTITASSYAGTTGRIFKFKVDFKDKNNSTYTILRPWDFLSNRAIARRARAGFAVTIDDLPVVSKYTDLVKATGVNIQLTSRWMNAALISTTDSALITKIKELSCVKSVQLMGVFNRKRNIAADEPEAAEEFLTLDFQESERILTGNRVSEEDFHDGYGLGWEQASMHNVQQLHQNGFKGKGIYITILDAGFYRANRMQAFDSIFKTGRFLGSVDLIDRGTGVFEDDDHGTQVLSCLASNIRGVMTGTAPEASYLLIRTEDAGAEVPAEEFQWLCGAEYADSVGTDLISSSLGYTEFDDVSMGHTYSELDGHTTLITQAANMACDRGIIIVNSAGNEGDLPWRHIGAPADAVGVMAIGAVDEEGNTAAFSSFGPTADGRIKPDLMAMGKRAVVINSNGYFIRSNGTSFSAPVFAGAMACLLQSAYSRNPYEIRTAAMLSGDHFLKGDTTRGHGIPDLKLAYDMLHLNEFTLQPQNPFVYFPSGDTLHKGFDLKTIFKPNGTYFYRLTNKHGKLIGSGSIYAYENMLYAAHIEPAEEGEYTLEVNDAVKKWSGKFYFANGIKHRKKP